MQPVYLIKFAEIQEALSAAAHDLFASYNCPLEYVQDSADPSSVFDDAVTATIGYVGPNLRGALLLVTSRELVSALVPDLGPGSALEMNDAILCDVLGEFSNMLLGRLKIALLARDVVLHVAIPIAATASLKQLPSPTGGTSTWHAFMSTRGMVFARFHAVFETGFALPPPRTVSLPAVAEGGMVEF